MTLRNEFGDGGKEYSPKLVDIFVDMDGVLSDFDSHAKAHGKYDAKGGTKWDELDFKWWSTMPAYEGMKEFYAELKKIGTVSFLTGPIVSPECHYGKAEWVQRQWSKWALTELVICPAERKRYLAGPNRILIDDRIKNVEEWNAAGGIGIHHKGDYADTLAQVQKIVKGLQEKAKMTPPSSPASPAA